MLKKVEEDLGDVYRLGETYKSLMLKIIQVLNMINMKHFHKHNLEDDWVSMAGS